MNNMQKKLKATTKNKRKIKNNYLKTSGDRV